MKTSNHPLDFSGVEETAFLILYAKAIESQSQNPIIIDEKAEQLVNQLDVVLKDRQSKMADQHLNLAIEMRLIKHLALRAKKYDDIGINFLKVNPFGPLVNIGCGLDTRFFRLDNGKVNFYDLDLPEMIHLKQQLVEEISRYQMIGQSALDFSWMDMINNDGKPALFLMEGVLMYLPEEGVKSLILEIQKRFPGSEMVCELTNRLWVEGFLGKMAKMKIKRRAKMGDDTALIFGVESPDALEKWHEGIEFLEQWFYMDDNHPKLGFEKLFRQWKIFRETQYTVRYRLNGGK